MKSSVLDESRLGAVRPSEEEGDTLLPRKVTWAGRRYLRVIGRATESDEEGPGEREWSEKMRGSRIRGSLVNKQ